MRPSLAQSVVAALGGHRSGNGWMARCPAHADRTPSLSLKDSSDGKLLVHCFAGCKQADVIAALCACGLGELGMPSNWSPRLKKRTGPDRDLPPDKDRTAKARCLWRAARPGQGTLLAGYLASRSIRIPIPAALRFCAKLKHQSGGFHPVMIALVTHAVDNVPVGVHRTYLARDGGGKAPVKPNKMMLGPCRGGVVRLTLAAERLLIGEGIETCLSAMQATGHGAWAALSTSGLRRLDLPRDVQDVTILADGDEPGTSAAEFAANRWVREGRRVRIARAPQGLDFNDLLLGRPVSVADGGSQ